MIYKRVESEEIKQGISYHFSSWRKRLYLRVGNHIFKASWSLEFNHDRVTDRLTKRSPGKSDYN